MTVCVTFVQCPLPRRVGCFLVLRTLSLPDSVILHYLVLSDHVGGGEIEQRIYIDQHPLSECVPSDSTLRWEERYPHFSFHISGSSSKEINSCSPLLAVFPQALHKRIAGGTLTAGAYLKNMIAVILAIH